MTTVDTLIHLACETGPETRAKETVGSQTKRRSRQTRGVTVGDLRDVGELCLSFDSRGFGTERAAWRLSAFSDKLTSFQGGKVSICLLSLPLVTEALRASLVGVVGSLPLPIMFVPCQ